jgi:uncharacterized membrane protein YhaH (DUF805 family)
MTFGEWYVRRGRIPRRTFWLHYTLPLALLGILASVADASLGYQVFPTAPVESDSMYTYTGGPVSTLVSLLTLVPSISSTVTRLHDRGHSAWWLLWWLLPVIGWVLLIVQTGFLRGTGRPNRYGPPPAPGQAGTRPWTF